MLNCRSSGTAGYIVFSGAHIRLRLHAVERRSAPIYQGNKTLGAQIGFTNDVALGWAIFRGHFAGEPGCIGGRICRRFRWGGGWCRRRGRSPRRRAQQLIRPSTD